MRAFIDRHRFLLRFATLSTVMGVSVGLAKVTTSLYAIELGADEATLGLIAGAQSVGVILMGLPVGMLVDRHGPAPVFVAGTLLAAAIYFAVPLVPAATFLLAMTALVSFFMPMRFVAMNSVFLVELENLGHARAGLHRGTHVVGMFLLGPMLAVGLVESVGFAGSFWCVAALFALSLVLVPSVLGDRPPEPFGAAARTSFARRLGLLASEPELRAACLVDFTAQAANMYYAFFIIPIAITERGLGRRVGSQLVSVQGGAFVLALFLLGGALPRFGRARFSLISYGLASAAACCLGLARSELALWVGGAALGLGLGLVQIANLTTYARLGARLGRGQVAGLGALAGPGGALFGSVAGGALGHVVTLQGVFLVMIPIFGALAGASMLRPRSVSSALG